MVVVIAVQGVWLYFSPAHWPAGTFETGRSQLMESLPPPWSPRPRLIADENLGNELFIPAYDDMDRLTVENWLPTNGERLIYAFNAPLLVPFYTHLFGESRVRNFYGSFRVDLEPRDWSWLRLHGCVHEIRRRMLAPALRVQELGDRVQGLETHAQRSPFFQLDLVFFQGWNLLNPRFW